MTPPAKSIMWPFPRPPGARELLEQILAQLKTMEAKMSDLSDAIDKLTADDTALEAEVEALIAVIQGIPAVVAKAVSDALAAAGTDTTAATSALKAVDDAVTAETAKAVAALAPPTA